MNNLLTKNELINDLNADLITANKELKNCDEDRTEDIQFWKGKIRTLELIIMDIEKGKYDF